jgi:hypothetical protein
MSGLVLARHDAVMMADDCGVVLWCSTCEGVF